MILLEEKKSKKLPGLTSLFMSIPYNKEVVEAIHNSFDVYYFDKKKASWELPIVGLSTFLDYIYNINDIEIRFLSESNVESHIEIKKSRFITSPFKYQLEGIDYGVNHDSWLLLDAPGLGKTLQIIYIAQELKRIKKIEHCLIICGINTLKSNWKKEIEKHSNLSCMILGERQRKKSGEYYFGGIKERVEDLSKKIKEFFVISNIETFRDPKIVKLINSGKNNFDMIVVDEIHTCRSLNSRQGSSLLKLNGAKYKIGATGTLFVNNPLDMYVPLKWIGIEKSNQSTFKKFYCKLGGSFGNEILGYKNLNFLKEQLDTCSLRRTKDLLELPEKTIINEYIDLDINHEKFYNNIKNGIIDQVDLVHMSTTSLLAMIIRLRQATACPQILTTENIESSKINRALELINEIVSNREKVVVFSTFKKSLEVLANKLNKKDLLICTGDTKDIEIENNKELFQNNKDKKIFLATWQKMGTGITLTAASYMIFLDTPWTWSDYEQAQDRIYRIGTKNKVTIYNLICKNTIDERVLDIVTDKQSLGDYLIDDRITENGLNSLKKYISEISQK